MGASLLLMHVADGWVARNYERLNLAESEEMKTDRAYLDTTHAVEIVDPVLRRRLRIEKQDSRSTVVWNPWSTGAQTMADLGDDEWQTMACVEASNMRACGVDLAAGATHRMKTRISVEAAPGDAY